MDANEDVLKNIFRVVDVSYLAPDNRQETLVELAPDSSCFHTVFHARLLPGARHDCHGRTASIVAETT